MSSQQPAFKGFLKASGQAEVWDDTDRKKFDQFGWRTRTSESAYSSATLIGNWNEEHFDASRMAHPSPLPSQYDHYFETSYREAHHGPSGGGQAPVITCPQGHQCKAFPAHQPEFDPPHQFSAFLTSSQEAYGCSRQAGIAATTAENSQSKDS